MLFLAHALFCKLCGTAPGVGDVGYDIVGLLDHPLITPGDSKARMDGFDALREHGVGVIAGIKLVSFWGQTCVRRSERSPRPAKLSSGSAEIEQWDRPD